MISKKLKKTYLENKGSKCLMCESQNIEGERGYEDIHIDMISHNVSCLECGASWKDIYKLIDVEERD